MTSVTILDPGPLATVQDLGRGGYAHLGVPHSGAADRAAMTLANRLVGNDETAAVIETTMGRLHIRANDRLLVAVTGAIADVYVDATTVGAHTAISVPAGSDVFVSSPAVGCRNYLAVRGGIAVDDVLGSRSTDTLSDLGPAPLRAGDELPVGSASDPLPPVTSAPVDATRPTVVTLVATPGPRRDQVRAPEDLAAGEWVVSPASDRVGVRLDRDGDAPLMSHRADADELASEGIAHGSVQIPPSGRPVIFLADHPVTGGYPVIAVLTASSIDRAAQLVAGQRIRFRMQ